MSIIKGIHIKPYKCRECGEDRPSKFQKGYRGICSKCQRRKRLQYQRSYYKAWYAENRRNRADNYVESILEYQQEHPDRVIASRKLRNALRKNIVVKPTKCEDCGRETRLAGHHSDYLKPLQVRWLCASCHKLQHLVVDLTNARRSDID